MDKVNQKIKELEAEFNTKIKELKKAVKEQEKFPKYMQDYWSITCCGEIQKIIWENDADDRYKLKMDNCFETREELEKAIKNDKTKAELQQLAKRLNKGVKIAWNNGSQLKYYIYSTECYDELMTKGLWYYKDIGQIYCLDPEFLNIAKEEIGKEKIINLIKSGR